VDFWAGRWSAAAANATEGLRLARDTRQDTSACRHRATLALLAALRGGKQECRRHTREVLAVAGARSLGMHAAYAVWAQALLELGVGRPEIALTHLEALRDAGVGASHPVVVRDCVPDLIEAAARSGRLDRCEFPLARFEAWAADGGAAWAMALVARCHGLLSAGAAADRHFRTALALHGTANRPFDRARTALLWGEKLRRDRQRAAARAPLRLALEGFEQLGARPWAAKARIELRASGETARSRTPSTLDSLTPQEVQIARFVAEGATNREVAARLFLSRRTVDHHLSNVFAKLGISSRGELILQRTKQLGTDTT
jgi:DNA-binding CsgD family transcriptional regulator